MRRDMPVVDQWLWSASLSEQRPIGDAITPGVLTAALPGSRLMAKSSPGRTAPVFADKSLIWPRAATAFPAILDCATGSSVRAE